MGTFARAALAVLCLAPGWAEGKGSDVTTTIDLITVAPGDHLFQRFGHTALMVMKTRPGTRRFDSIVYNYGDADFDAPGFAVGFLRGRVNFRIISTGDLAETVGLYASDNRTIFHQRLNLTADQVRRLEAKLAFIATPLRREYPYHFLRSSCATKARDVLDEILGGVIQAQLGKERDRSVREYARRGYAGNLIGEIFNDLFMGRLMDLPRTKHFSLYLPSLLMDYLQQVKVPDPRSESGVVPLADPPTVLYARQGPPPTTGEGRRLIAMACGLLVLVLASGVFAYFGGSAHPRWAGGWLLLWSLPMGLAALLMVTGALLSTVAEGRVNELLMVFPPTDAALWVVAVRWLRARPGTGGRSLAGPLLQGYAWTRLAMVLVSLLGHATGVLFQEPRVMVFLGLACAAGLVAISRRLAVRASGR
jgi:hypothetical protein